MSPTKTLAPVVHLFPEREAQRQRALRRRILRVGAAMWVARVASWAALGSAPFADDAVGFWALLGVALFGHLAEVLAERVVERVESEARP